MTNPKYKIQENFQQKFVNIFKQISSFFRSRTTSPRQRILYHNTITGVNIVKRNVRENCECVGYGGDCNNQVSWCFLSLELVQKKNPQLLKKISQFFSSSPRSAGKPRPPSTKFTTKSSTSTTTPTTVSVTKIEKSRLPMRGLKN